MMFMRPRNNAMAAGGGEGRRQEHATSRWRGAGADRYRGPSYDAYNDATRRYPEQSQHQQQPSHLWYPPATNNRESPTSSSSTSSTSAAEDSAGSRRALHHQRQRRHRGDDDADDDTRFFVAFTFVLELLIIIGLALLEYFLRKADYFPIREVTFSCTDAEISYKLGHSTYSSFAYTADVPYEAVIIVAFCLPPFIISVSELVLWLFSTEDQKTVRLFCQPCRLPQPLRRIVRFTGAFVFGLLMTMIFIDVTKMMTGRLRPTFMDTCIPNWTLCLDAGRSKAANVCLQDDANLLRAARQSFPSMLAAVTAFAACFLAVYVHNVSCASRKVRVLRPFVALSFVMMSLLCCLARYGLRYNHWTDVVVGFVVGVLLAVYICSYVLNNFLERLSGRRLYARLHDVLLDTGALHALQVVDSDWPSTPSAAPQVIRNKDAFLPGQPSVIIPRPQLTADAVAAGGGYGTLASSPRSDPSRPATAARRSLYQPAVGAPASYRYNDGPPFVTSYRI